MGNYPRNPIKTARWPTFLIRDPPFEKRCFNLIVNLPFKRWHFAFLSRPKLWAGPSDWGEPYRSPEGSVLPRPCSQHPVHQLHQGEAVRPSTCSSRSALRRTPNFAQRQSAGRRRLTFLVRENAWEIPSRFVVAFFFLSSFKTQKRNMRRMWWRGVAFQILTILSRGCICVKSKNHWKYTWSAEALTEDWAPWHPWAKQREPKQHAASACTSAFAVLPSLARLLRLLARVLSPAPQKKKPKPSGLALHSRKFVGKESPLKLLPPRRNAQQLRWQGFSWRTITCRLIQEQRLLHVRR